MIQLRLTVEGLSPKIWRRLAVRESMWLSRLHEAIQISFDWYDYQLHRFVFGEERYGNPQEGVVDDRDLALADLGMQPKDSFRYEYDFGPGWGVEVLVESISATQAGGNYPTCLGGERASPPEDCGGPEGYQELLYALDHPDSALAKEWIAWIGPEFDAAAFAGEQVNRNLKRLMRT